MLSIRSIARDMIGDLQDYDAATISLWRLSSNLKGRLALLEDVGADQAWVDELRTLRNAIEYVSAFFIESRRTQLTEDEKREVNDVIDELRAALISY